MEDELQPWVDAMEPASSSVDPRVLVGTGLWLVVFGWYVILQATPAFGLAGVEAALLYGFFTFVAGTCFGWGEAQIAETCTRFLDRHALAFGGLALASAGLSWFLVTRQLTAYAGGLWLGVVLLGSGILVGAAGR